MGYLRAGSGIKRKTRPLMKKFLKYCGYTLLTIVALVLLYLGSAWGLSRIGVAAEKDAAQEVNINLLSNGVHVDIVVPARHELKDWTLSFPYSRTRNTDTTYDCLAFGWGDKGFYLNTPTWDDLTFGTAFRAAFGLSTSAVHATYCKNLEEGNDCVALRISEDQYQRLIVFIEKSLDTDSTGRPVWIPTDAAYGMHDAFYEAKGRYHLFHTCNTWTNNALKACGQKACWWTPFESGVMKRYR